MTSETDMSFELYCPKPVKLRIEISDQNKKHNIQVGDTVPDYRLNKQFSISSLRNGLCTLSVYNEKNESFDFKIFDVTGKCLESVSGIISNEVEIDKNTLPAGLYVFRLSSEKGTVISGKFIVE